MKDEGRRVSGVLGMALAGMLVLGAGCATSPTRLNQYNFPEQHGRTYVEIGSLSPTTLLTLRAYGDVNDVIAGEVPEESNTWRRAADYRIGFGAGSPTDMEGLGEFMSLNGVAYAKNTNRAEPTYYETVSGTEFLTTASIFVPLDAEPNLRVTHRGFEDNPTTLDNLYGVIFEGTGGRPFVVAGLIEFENCETLAVSRAPINREPLFENREKYYEFGPESREGAVAVVMGIAGNFEMITDDGLRRDLARILYYNPYDISMDVVSHAHALILNETPRDWRRVRPYQVNDVDHLLSQSTVRRAWLDVYVVGAVD